MHTRQGNTAYCSLQNDGPLNPKGTSHPPLLPNNQLRQLQPQPAVSPGACAGSLTNSYGGPSPSPNNNECEQHDEVHINVLAFYDHVDSPSSIHDRFHADPDSCSGIDISTQLTIFLIHDQTTYLPSGFATAESSFFSPSIACPSGYWSACHDNTGVPSVTTVTCCRTFRSDMSLSCLNPATLAEPWVSLFCTYRPCHIPETLGTFATPSSRTIRHS